MCIVIKSKYEKVVEENTNLQSKCLDLKAELQRVSTLLDQEKSITDGLRLQLIDAMKLQAKLDESLTERLSLQAELGTLILEDGEIKEHLTTVLSENEYLISDLTKTQLELQQSQHECIDTAVVLSRITKELKG